MRPVAVVSGAVGEQDGAGYMVDIRTVDLRGGIKYGRQNDINMGAYMAGDDKGGGRQGWRLVRRTAGA